MAQYLRHICCYLFLLSFAFSVKGNAEQSKLLTVYTYDSMVAEWGLGPIIKDEFEKTCACNLKFVSFQDGVTLLTRLKLDGDRSPADVILGLDNYIADEIFFQAHNIGNTLQPDSPSAKYFDDFFVPYDFGFFAFVGRKNSSNPKSFKELLSLTKNFELLIGIQDPRSSTPGLGLAMWVNNIFKAEATEAWKTLKPAVAFVTPGWSQSYSLFLKGESDIVMSYTTSPLYHSLAESDDGYQWLEFDEGHLIQVELAGITKFSKNYQLAQAFLQTLLTDEVQSQVSVTNWMFPVNLDLVSKEFNRALPKKIIELSRKDILSGRKNALDNFLTAFY